MKAQIESMKLDEIQDAVQTIQGTVETIQEVLSDQSEQIGRLHDEVTGEEGGHAGGRFAPYSLVDIGNMLRGLQTVFESQFKAKAFELFDEETAQYKKFGQLGDGEAEKEALAALVPHTVRVFLGLGPFQIDRFYQEWKAQRSNQE